MRKRLRTILSALLTLAMLLTLLPTSAFAAGETGTFTKITSQTELTDGQYVLVVNTGYAVGALESGWLTAAAVTDNNGSLSNPAANLIWNLTVTAASVTLTDANNTQIAPSGGNTNGIKSSPYAWKVSFENGMFRFEGTGEDTVILASNKSQENKFRAYKRSTVSGKPNGYPSIFTLYKYVDGTGTPGPDPGEEPDPQPVASPIADGDQVIIYSPAYGRALSSEKAGNYNVGTAVTVADDGTVSSYVSANVWTVIDNQNGSFSFQQNGQSIGINENFSSLNLGVADDQWRLVPLEDGTFNIQNVTRGNYLEWYAQYENWSTYNSASAATDDQFKMSFYKVTGGIPDPGPTEPETVTIAQALAAGDGTADITVKGVVTFIDGKNVYLQDSTGGICAYMSSTPAGLSLGDTIIATGNRTTYSGLPELQYATYEISSGLSLTPAVRTIGELTNTDICTYVTIRNVTVTEVYDNNGQYSSPNITVTDGTNSIQLYRAAVDKAQDGTWPVAAGDIITITAAVGVYGDALQLRNTQASEIALGGTPAGPIAHGDRVVIYNPAYQKALSANYAGFYNQGTTLTAGADGTLSGFTAADVWTVIENSNGTWSFSYSGQNIGMETDYTSMPLGGPYDQWVLMEADNGLYYIKNSVRNAYMEYQDNYGTWSAYHNISSGSENMFALSFYQVTGEIPDQPGGETELPESFVIYNAGAQGVLAGQDDNQASPSINNAAATLENGAATPANGARVFTAAKTERGTYTFHTADGYLTSNGTGNNAFYQAQADAYSEWELVAFNGGYRIKNLTAKYNGSSDQYLEYYGGSYKTYSFYSDSDSNIYTFNFYPLSENVTVTNGVVNIPAVVFSTLPEAYAGQAYTISFTVDSVFDVDVISAQYGNTTAELTNDDGTYSFTIPAEAMTAGELPVTITGRDTEGVAISGSLTLDVKDEPVILSVFPAPNTQTEAEKRPEIGITFGNAGDAPTVTLTVNKTDVDAVVTGNKASYTPAADMADGKVTVTATVTRSDNKTVSRTWNFTIGTAQYQLYFGQLHSHTAEYSDGTGTLQEGLDYVANLPESANVDFVAFTDHSNSFDTKDNANPEAALYDISQMTEESARKWSAYTEAIDTFNTLHAGELVVLAGFEMTWSGGPGHINTFNTPGLVSRNNATLNSKTGDAGLQAYYALLSNENLADSISQFNHPGTTFGNFIDFGYYDPIIDTRMYLVEVGNGEGAIGTGGYFPSYEQYIMALDKGWHVAPTNNQDNHKGMWGNANDARDVILTDDFSEAGLYNAIRQYRVYATEDKNLEIQYTLNGQMMGSIIEEVPETASINVSLYDPDFSDSIARVEVVVNSGAVAYTWSDPAELASGELTCIIPANYNYYFIRVIQSDGDIAVTAPVWIGDVVKLGISSAVCGTAIPVTDEALTLTTTLFNSEATDATVSSITYTSDGEVLGTDTTVHTLPASSTLAVDWTYTPTTARMMTVTVTAVVEQNGIQYTYSKDVTLDIQDASQLIYIGIDASHYNEYVAGNYKDSMGNFSNLAAGYLVRTVMLKTSNDLIAACENENGKYKAIILTAPSRRLEAAQEDPRTYSDAELDAIAAFNAAGGTVIVAGWADYYENYTAITGNPDIVHMAATQNAILEKLGSSLRIADDTASDDVLNGSDSNRRLYLSTYNFDSFLMDGVEFDPENPNDNFYSQLYSHYGGSTIYAVDSQGAATATLPATVSPVVYGHSTTYSKDNDSDGLGGSSVPTYAVGDGDNRVMVLATEQLANKGLIIVSGAAFMSDFEVKSQPDSTAEKNYSNYTICENLVNYLNPVTITPIAAVQAQEQEHVKYTIEGVLTSNASGYDTDTAFFDCVYLQDDTAGINAFPVAGNFKAGDKVRITGTTSSYQGERQINVISITKIGEEAVPAPKTITADQLNDGSVLGSLVTLKGTVVSFEENNGTIQTIMVRDSAGNLGRVFIDGYITSQKEIQGLEVGCTISATGLASYDNTFNAPDGPFPRIRVRDRTDVVCTKSDPGGDPDIPPVIDPPIIDPPIIVPPADTPTQPADPGTTQPQPVSPDVFTDLGKDAWYYEDVAAVIESGLMNGVSENLFAPEQPVNRGMVATILYRLSGENSVGGSSFADVAANAWYGPAVAWANSTGVVQGLDNGLFAPTANTTREQIVVMLYRYAQYQKLDCTASSDLSIFSDDGQVSDYAREAMEWAVAVGLIQGRDGQLIAPRSEVLRCELCTMLVRFQKLLV